MFSDEGKMKIKVSFEVQKVLNNFKKLRITFEQAIITAIEQTAKVLLIDCRPYIPMLTGRLRDSGHIEEMKKSLNNYAFKLVWDAANPATNYIYAQRQYEDVLQHVDGKYAARWVESVLRNNPDRYVLLCARYLAIALSKALGNVSVEEV